MKQATKEVEAEQLRGCTKAAVLKNDPDCPDLLCCSIYDQKPVHMMSTVAECMDWDENKSFGQERWEDMCR
jgi:hypothetical protein